MNYKGIFSFYGKLMCTSTYEDCDTEKNKILMNNACLQWVPSVYKNVVLYIDVSGWFPMGRALFSKPVISRQRILPLMQSLAAVKGFSRGNTPKHDNKYTVVHILLNSSSKTPT